MKKVLLTCLLAFAALTTFAQQTTPPNSATECTEAFFQALLDENGAALRSLLTTDFAIVSFDGSLVDSGTLAEGMNGGYINIEAATLAGTSTRNYGDTGIVTGTWRAKGTLQGSRFENTLAFTSVCVRQGGAWKVASVQMTPTM
ncbi:nuclear transport factor 2 family protein [Persicitalea sp.]|uniref:nuclear transport factor 2 family protein n=1 Tax=Persicitalea sp. TaxID=3100273 RepID=UPI003593D108